MYYFTIYVKLRCIKNWIQAQLRVMDSYENCRISLWQSINPKMWKMITDSRMERSVVHIFFDRFLGKHIFNQFSLHRFNSFIIV